MGIIRRALTVVNGDSGGWNDVLRALSGRRTIAGVTVDERKALTISAVWSAVNILSQNIGTLPLPAMQKTAEGRRKADELNLYWVLSKRANAWMTAATYRMTMMLHLALWRVSYSHIERNGFGDIIGLWPLMPDRTRLVVKDGARSFETRLPDGSIRRLPPDDVLHVLAPSLNGIEAVAMVDMARETLGQILAAQEFGSRLYSNGLNTNGFVTSDQTLDKAQREQIHQQVSEQIQGLDKAHDLLLLPFGLKWQPMSTDPQKAQMLETREFLISEVARWFNMPPHKLGVMNKGMAYASVEQMQLAFVQETLRPWLIMIEEAMDTALFTEDQWKRQGYYVRHNVDGLLRADSKTRAEVFHIMRLDGVISANQWLDLMDMNRQPGEQGDMFWMPVNMMPASEALNKSADGERDSRLLAMARLLTECLEPRSAPATDEKRAADVVVKRQRLSAQYRTLFTDAAARIVRREVQDLRRKAKEAFGKRDAATFESYLSTYYIEHAAHIERTLMPVVLSLLEASQESVAAELEKPVGVTADMEEFARKYVQIYAERHGESSLGQLRAVLRKAMEQGEDQHTALTEHLDGWEESRAEQIGRRESTRALNVLVKSLFVLYGVRKMRWNVVGDNCPHCRALDGKVVEVTGSFMHAGDESNPDGAPSALKTFYSVKHPPAHDGCNCVISAG